MKSFFQKCDPYTADKEGTAVQRIWQSAIGDAARGWSQNSINSRIINLIKLYKLGAPEDIQRISCILKHTELIDEDLRINNQTWCLSTGHGKNEKSPKDLDPNIFKLQILSFLKARIWNPQVAKI